MKKFYLLLALHWFAPVLFAQNFVKTLRPGPSEREWTLENPVAVPEPFTAVSAFLSARKPVQLRYATAAADRRFSDWRDWPEDPHLRDGSPAERQAHDLLFLEKEVRFLKIGLAPSSSAEDLRGELALHFFNPNQKTAAPAPPRPAVAGERDACDCALPAFRDRSQWCTTGNCPPSSSPTPTTVTHLIIHHSAGPNTATNWNAVVTSVWSFHVNSNGWADIGYNWLIAPDGTLFEGRGDNIVGAHFCSTNGGTMGVCMLGTFTDADITAAARATLVQLLAWKCCARNLDPTSSALHLSSGLNLRRISGHRDGCATECPGNALYPTLPALRDSVAATLAACTSPANTGELAESEPFRLYPNPVLAGKLYWEMPAAPNEPMRFSLFDGFGKLAQQSEIRGGSNGEISLPSQLPAGLYFWKCETGGRVFSGTVNVW